MNEELSLFINDGINEPIPIVLSSHCTILDIQDYLNLSPGSFDFYYNSIKLMTAFSLGWYGIADGAQILVVPHQNDQSKDKGPKFMQKNSSLAYENAKIRDQFFQKIEGTVSSYRKITHKILRVSRKSSQSSQYPSPTVIPDPSPAPCDSELPAFWVNDSSSSYSGSPY